MNLSQHVGFATQHARKFAPGDVVLSLSYHTYTNHEGWFRKPGMTHWQQITGWVLIKHGVVQPIGIED